MEEFIDRVVVVTFIVAFITFVYVWLRFERYFSHHRTKFIKIPCFVVLVVGVNQYDYLRDKDAEKTKRIALGVGVPLSTLFVVLLVVSSIYVWRLRRRLRRRNCMLAIAIRGMNEDNALQMFLPTYDDALKTMPTTPPPTFEEVQEEMLWGKSL